MRRWLLKVGEILNRFLSVIALMFKLLLKGEIKMIDMYVALIIAGRRTIDQVPERYRDAVIADLAALGLDENGNPIEN